MVKHPRHMAMDDARQLAFPKVFEQNCSREYNLQRVEPKRVDPPCPGPILRPTFHVFKDEFHVAEFHPNGSARCIQDDFKVIFDKINDELEEIAQAALAKYEKDHPDY